MIKTKIKDNNGGIKCDINQVDDIEKCLEK